MQDNQLVLIDQVIAERQEARAVALPEATAFEVFACECALADEDLSAEEVEAGVVGGGGDGAIDGVYVLLGDTLLAEDSDIFQEDFKASQVAKGTSLRLILVQAKRETSFTETAIDLATSSTRRLLNLGEDEDDLAEYYSRDLIARLTLFRTALQKLATRHPKVQIKFVYATRGRTSEINTRVKLKARDLEVDFSNAAAGGEGSVEFLGGAELWERAGRQPSYTLQLSYKESATSGTSHVALVSLRDYFNFLTDENNGLRRHIFDWNVRDYQGDVEVNKEIADSLDSASSPEFWWLNNGITIICSRATIIGKTYSLDDVQIVNGLQSSHTIHRYLSSAPADHPAFGRSVLVRILVTEDPATRDLVIRATNRQTSVPAASLRATDDIQRSIETYFSGNGWYYDRRKNYYRNIGKSPERIVSIPLLAQAVMAMGLSQPHNSRARPSSLLKRDEDYQKIFSSKVPLAVYLWLAKAQREIDGFLLTEGAGTTPQERNNLRFHLAMLAAMRLHGRKVYAPQQLAKIAEEDTSVADADLPFLLGELRDAYYEFGDMHGYSDDKSAKGSEFVEYLFNRISNNDN
ncbi:AIPR family protein [Amycolatopsis methanolica]|uniref:AIPR family protein n=1 Tax=Amycolatopsis methanolica TaxID=1814 RepID=UPI003426E2EA